MSETLTLLEELHEGSLAAIRDVGRILPEIARAAELVANRLDAGGRLVYVGAGTSGRLGALDAAEIPPTFGTEPDVVVGLMAGGEEALFHAVEGAEDDEVQGAGDMRIAEVSSRDAVVGIAASGATPYVAGALRWARSAGALTIALVCTPGSRIAALAELALVLDSGPEVPRGSTRMRAGTAQKVVLNMLSTAVMARRGRVYRGEMVAMKPTNRKLKQRAVRIARDLLALPPESAERLLVRAGWDLPVALVSEKWGLSLEKAQAWLERQSGNVARALTEEPRWP